MRILLRLDHIPTPTIPIPMLQAHIGPVGAFIPAFRLLATTGDTGAPDIGPVEVAGTNLVVSGHSYIVVRKPSGIGLPA